MTHGGAAPQVRAKAALRLALLMDPALKVYADILKGKDHPDASRVAMGSQPPPLSKISKNPRLRLPDGVILY